ncbi:DUF2007 domain-containing protein [Marinobacter sp. BGYM27]|uniref:putative signal transducing protein n=1 Tax=unclassified Marinobacter TaxID=83889 RepID=UPI0021A6383F|nr:DUF2007 domain-containing protein [Marinobacter sp. BGYM27]MDG5499448.1 DUF2007 domain-containing protein [Marinobacter sp. BGYM27]
MSWVTIARYSLPFEAHVARARLESEGIDALVMDEHTINMQWLYSDAMGGVRLQVDEAYCQRAESILNEDRSDLVDDSIAPGLASRDTSGPAHLTELADQRYRRGFFMAFLFWFIGS